MVLIYLLMVKKFVGTFGDVSTWSFCQDKIMSTAGEGGMVATNNKNIWDYIWSLKDHGKSYDEVYKKNSSEGFKWLHNKFGNNYRITEYKALLVVFNFQN